MNFLEALREARDTEAWFRPKSWRGCKMAFKVTSAPEFDHQSHAMAGAIMMVPGPNGGMYAVMPEADIMLSDDWEVVDPCVVNRGA